MGLAYAAVAGTKYCGKAGLLSREQCAAARRTSGIFYVSCFLPLMWRVNEAVRGSPLFSLSLFASKNTAIFRSICRNVLHATFFQRPPVYLNANMQQAVVP